MSRSGKSIPTTHTGALPRDELLREKLAEREEGGEVDRAALDSAIRNSVNDVVAKQVAVGLTIVNDGENGKYSFAGYIKDRLTGFSQVSGDEIPAGTGAISEERDFPEYFRHRPNLDLFARRREGLPGSRTCCVGPISWKDFSEVERDIANLKQAAEGYDIDLFMSSTSPGNVLQKTPNRHYENDDAYLQAICDAMKLEYEAIVNAGIVLQLDCPDLASRSGPEGYGLEDFRSEVERNIEALNYATRDIEPDMMRIHVCWGSDERPHHLDRELKDFVDILLKARPAGMTIVAANGRHQHEWRVWEGLELPEGKVIIPGVIDSTTNIVEHPETVADRILRFVDVLGPDRIIAGVDCGFQTSAGRDQVDTRVAWAKLRSLAEGASVASQRL